MLFNHLFGVGGLMIAEVVSDNSALILGTILYLIVMKKVIAEAQEETE